MDIANVRIAPVELPSDEVGWFRLARTIQDAISGSELTRLYDHQFFLLRRQPFFAVIGPFSLSLILTTVEEIASSWQFLSALRECASLNLDSVTFDRTRQIGSPDARYDRLRTSLQELSRPLAGEMFAGIQVNVKLRQDVQDITLRVDQDPKDDHVLVTAVADVRLSDATEEKVAGFWAALAAVLESFMGGGEGDAADGS